VAVALAVFRGDEWVGQIGTGLTTVSVKVQQPAIEHQVKIQDFLAWLGKKAGSPAEIALRNNIEKNAFVKYGTSEAESLNAHRRMSIVASSPKRVARVAQLRLPFAICSPTIPGAIYGHS
jgi:hypothetical protein